MGGRWLGAALVTLGLGTTPAATCLGAAPGTAQGGSDALDVPAPHAEMNLDEQLVQTYAARLHGGVVTAGCGLRGKGPAMAFGTIDLSGIPAGAGVVKAILNWVSLDSAPASSLATFHEISRPAAQVSGTLLGSDASPCWSGSYSAWVWSADVTAAVVASGNATYTVGLPDSGVLDVAPIAEGAALIVIYCDPASPRTHVVVYEGVQTVNNGKSTQTVTGFVASSAVPQPDGAATFVIADGQGISYPTWGGRAKIAGSDVIGPPMDGDEGARCGAQLGEFYDVDTVSIVGLVAAGQTSITAEVESYPAPVQGDCLTWSALVLAVAADVVDPPPAACGPGCPVTPVVDAGPDRAICLGERVLLSASATPACVVGVAEWQWLAGTTPACPWNALPVCDVGPTATSIYTVEYRCVGEPCAGSDSLLITVDPDLPPGDLGNTLRAVEQGGDVAMSWGAVALARSYNLWRGVAKGAWPGPALRTGLATTTASEPDVTSPPPLYFYRVVGASCSGREGL